MKITRNRLKEIIKGVVQEEKEQYEKLFRSMLKKYGVKSPADLSDEQKKEFFDKIDAAYKAPGEKPEANESVSCGCGGSINEAQLKSSEVSKIQKGLERVLGTNVNYDINGNDSYEFYIDYAKFMIGVGDGYPKSEYAFDIYNDGATKYLADGRADSMNDLIKQILSAAKKHKNSLLQTESVNEVNVDDALSKFTKELENSPEVKKAAKHYKKSVKDIVKILASRFKLTRYSDKSVKSISINFKDNPSNITFKLSHSYKQNESVNEGKFKNLERELRNLVSTVKIDFEEALEMLEQDGVLEAMDHLEHAIERIQTVHKILKRKS